MIDGRVNDRQSRGAGGERERETPALNLIIIRACFGVFSDFDPADKNFLMNPFISYVNSWLT